jgi:hypothetical protein
LQLAEWRSPRTIIYYLPRDQARRYCGSQNIQIRVLPGSVREPLGFLVGRGETLEGVALRGLGLVYNPGWAEHDRIALWMGLYGAQLPGRSWVEGSWTGVLTARVELLITERYLGQPEQRNFLFPHAWDGTVLDVRVQGYDPQHIYNGETLPLQEAGGTVRGEATLRSVTSRREIGVDTSRWHRFYQNLGHNQTFTRDPGTGPEVFRAIQTRAECGFFGCTQRWFNIYDLQGRLRGYAHHFQQGGGWVNGVNIRPLLIEVTKTHEGVDTRIRPWRERGVWQVQGVGTVEPGGSVVVNGVRYQIPGLEAFGRRPPGVGIEWIRGEPLVSQMAMATGIPGGNVLRGQVINLADFCATLR